MAPKENSYRTPSDSSKTTSQSGRRTSAYNPSFKQNLIKHGVYLYEDEYLDDRVSAKPDNWEELQQKLAKSRSFFSPSRFSDGASSDFRRKTTRALDEADVMANAFLVIPGESDILSGIKKTFRTLAALTNGTIVNA